MPEDLENKDVKVNLRKKTTTRNSASIKKTAIKKTVQKSKNSKNTKIGSLNAEYKYEEKDGEKLIIDKPSTPLNRVETIKEVINVKSPIKTNGQIYDAYVKELEDFKLVYNGDVIFDSTLSKNNSILKFEADYFVLFGKKYSYNGLRVQKI